MVNAKTTGSAVNGAAVTLPHALQTSAVANAYRFVVVGVTGFGNGQANSQPAGVTYNGVTMVTAKQVYSGNQSSASIFYLPGASLPANAGTYSVLVTAAPGGNALVLTANVLELINVEQGLDAFGGSGSGTTCVMHTPSDAVSVSVAGGYIYSVAGVSGVGTDANANTSGQTITEQSTVGGLGTAAGYLNSLVAGPRTITWTLAICSASAHALISIKPVSTP